RLAEALTKGCHNARRFPWRATADEPNRRRCRLLRPCRERPSQRRTAEQRDELAAPCMSGKQHSEGRRGFGHDRLPVATGSPQALRNRNREGAWSSSRFFHTRTVAWARARINKEGIRRWQCSLSVVSTCRRIVWTSR